jgi:GH25 family lysozyme M1 (1,4-beta-N-acetylmuramidase)
MAAMTFDEYFRTVSGKGLDFDGKYGVQCFDLVNDYAVKVLGCKPFIGMSAWEIYENFGAQPSHARFTKIQNGPTFVPQKGDIVVWGKSLNGDSGHCAIATGEGTTLWFKSYEQNWTGNNDLCTVITHGYDHVLGVLRPKEQNNINKEAKQVAYKAKGIDISRYQGKPDFTKAKKEVAFVIMQAGYGKYTSQVDTSFEYNYFNCKQNNIPVGVYWYSYAKSVEDAHAEAKTCLEIIKNKQFEYPIYIDMEEGLGSLGRSLVSAIADTFCSDLEKAGYYAGIYMSRSPAQSYLTSSVVSKYALWLAEYASNLNWTGAVGMWQYSSEGKVSGIGGNVDMNYCYEDYPKIIKNAGLNGYTKVPVNTLDTTGFKQGDKNDGVLAYKQLLILARTLVIIQQKVDNNNSFGEGTTKATNEFLKSIEKNQNGIAGANTIKALGEKLKEVVSK